jgi:hypothetical protein
MINYWSDNLKHVDTTCLDTIHLTRQLQLQNFLKIWIKNPAIPMLIKLMTMANFFQECYLSISTSIRDKATRRCSLVSRAQPVLNIDVLLKLGWLLLRKRFRQGSDIVCGTPVYKQPTNKELPPGLSAGQGVSACEASMVNSMIRGR